MQVYFLQVVKAVLNISLAIIFWIIFGRVSVERFQKQNILVSSSTIPPDPEGLEMPGFTICKTKIDSSLGWRGTMNPSITSLKEVLTHKCGGAQNVTRCIEEGTFGQGGMHSELRKQDNHISTDFLWSSFRSW